jgi:hypothetical protein
MRTFIAAIVFLWCAAFVAAQESSDAKAGQDEALVAQRYDLMQKRLASVIVQSGEPDFPTAFAAKPIFRYSDPARGYVAAAIWKLGEQQRPRALITTELHRLWRGSPRIVYEYLSLTPSRFTVTSGDMRWSPESTALEFKPVPDAERPDDAPPRRLLQMRAIARRFVGQEVLGKEKTELRLLPQPVDRYTPGKNPGTDGGIFLFTFGTNPEIALFIESDGKAWSYAAGRLAGASRISLTLDGMTAWDGPPVNYALNQPYTASNAPADIPGIAPDGSEIK